MAELLSMLGSRKKQKVRTTVKHVQVQDGDSWMINQYKVLQTLGIGMFGEVYKVSRVINQSEQLFAIKKMRKKIGPKRFKKKDEGQLSPAVMRQIAVMKKMQHPNMLRLYEVIINPDDDKLFLVMELCENGQLLDWNQELCVFQNKRKMPSMRRIVRDCVKALHFMHLQNIFHRDIKPENILFDQKGVAKFGDFGISLIGEASDQYINEIQGTQSFYPPQYIHAMEGDGIWKFKGKAVDIWALGITFYALAFNLHPFMNKSDDIQSMRVRILNQPVNFPDDADPGLMRLLSRMLHKSPIQRITIDQIINHSWVNEGEDHLSSEIKNEIIRVSKSEVHESYSVYSIQLAHKFIQKMKAKRDMPVRDSKKPQVPAPIRRDRIYSPYNHFTVKFHNTVTPKGTILSQNKVMLNGVEHKAVLIHRPDLFNSVKLQVRGEANANLFVQQDQLPADKEEMTKLLLAKLQVSERGEPWLSGIQYFTVEAH